MAIIRTQQGIDADWQITLKDGLGNTVVTYTDEDLLSVQVWSGEDTGILFLPHAEWIDAASGTIRLSLSSASTMNVPPARYRVRVLISTTDGLLVNGFEGWLDIQPSPGTSLEPSTYCTFNDLLMLAPWLSEEQTETDQAGFVEQRALARRWIDQIIVNSHPYPCHDLQPLLDANALRVTQQVTEIAAKYSVGLIISNVLSGTDSDSSYQTLGRRFLAEANSAMLNLVAKVGDLSVDCGRTSIRRVAYAV